MSALTFRLKGPPPERLDLSRLVPDLLGGHSVLEIARLPVGTSRLGATAGDMFEIADGERDDILILSGCERLDRVGEGLDRGRLRVEGDVGQRLAVGMKGGEVHVSGSAGPFAASAATGGLVRIDGDAAERAGGALCGAMHGLNGAVLVIGGRAGPRLGDRMRRGMILVEGAVGDLAGSRMIAGTIVTPRLGDHPGFGMRRGTILTERCGELLPSFVETGQHALIALALMRGAVAGLSPHLAEMIPATVRRFAGDLATLGRGEILLCRDDARPSGRGRSSGHI